LLLLKFGILKRKAGFNYG